jgi:hypothetical protein
MSEATSQEKIKWCLLEHAISIPIIASFIIKYRTAPSACTKERSPRAGPGDLISTWAVYQTGTRAAVRDEATIINCGIRCSINSCQELGLELGF